ncbi:conserved Plasmodium protein, unknown function [Plasmodium gallinaceum]|uniref:GPI transamidase component PIG-S n=1 Tax=Plasmodium gallinaceum TaxID=5849 RepID=A0A1J1GXX6_PLAGA|nr:conserved Plasmodium protein, unknown function [Plasmodium gallinaceum]CRG97112.1 conserved Plasmodium protein, unknown function [Plasmodium gallinaceum]
MNSRFCSIIFYTISLIVYSLFIYFLNKYERQKIPTKKIKHIYQLIEDNYRKRQNINKLNNEIKEKYDSSFSINLYIVSACSKENSDIFGEKLISLIKEKINTHDKEEKKLYKLFNENDLFYINLYLINKQMIENDETRKYSDICEKLYSKNKPHLFIGNYYYVYVNQDSEKEENLSFTLSTTNIIEIHYKKVQGIKNNNYEEYINESWNILKGSFFFKTNNRVLEYIPEVDLNFYLASSLYNEKNYKIEKYSYDKGKNENKNIDININDNKQTNENINKIKDSNEDNEENGINDDTYIKKNIKKLKIPVSIATWNFYDDFYYPYMRNFIERLLNIFQINIYPQIIGNINLYEISEKAEVYIKEKQANIGNNTRLILLDKVTKFTDAFDNVSFDNILKKPSYEIPKNINLVAIFPNEEEIFFYNNLSEKIETSVSFIEWGIIYINNSFTRLKKFEKEENKIINVSKESHAISGMFVSHLRKFLGLCANFNDCIFNFFDSDKYQIKYLNTTSEENDSSITYSITTKNDLIFSFIYHIPIKNSISDYEILSLIREAYIYRINESLKNVKKFLSISNISIYMKVPSYTFNVFNNILNNIECSLSYMEGKTCKYLHISKSVEENFQHLLKGNKNNNYNKEIYLKVALILAQSAYQDSLQLLSDDKLNIYDILSKDFLLATMLPTVFPFVFPVIFALFKEFFRIIKIKKVKED